MQKLISKNTSDLFEMGDIVYKCLDGRLAIEEDNRSGRLRVRYLTTAEIKELEKKMARMEKLEKLEKRRGK